MNRKRTHRRKQQLKNKTKTRRTRTDVLRVGKVEQQEEEHNQEKKNKYN